MTDILRDHLQVALNSTIETIEPVSGGSINEAARISLKSGEARFVKWNASPTGNMFKTEAKGLETLMMADSDLVFPEIISQGEVPDTDIQFLIMDYFSPHETNGSFFEKFGRELARLHRNGNEVYGLGYDNFIGRLPQDNTPSKDWIDFFIERRIRPQFEIAVDGDQLPYTLNQNFERLLEMLPDLLPEEKPSLLHGDLWSGNYLCVSNDQAALIDPAVYYGNREIELAFTKLFGGFSYEFYAAYQEAFPIQPGFDNRVDIYNLYPLLVHVNMFGRAYASQVQAILNNY
ncbi:MAG: fructosamine kinase family protein [Balneolales bacterium]